MQETTATPNTPGMTRMQRVAIVMLSVITTGLAALSIYLMAENHRLKTVDATPELATVTVNDLNMTVGSCHELTLTGYSSVEESSSGLTSEQHFEDIVEDHAAIYCPLLPDVHEPHPDSTPHISAFGYDWEHCTARFKPHSYERPDDFLGLFCEREH